MKTTTNRSMGMESPSSAIPMHRPNRRPEQLRPCEIRVRDDSIYEFRETTQPTNFSVYYRGDPRENEAALREALPALYLSFQTACSNGNQQRPAQ